MTEPTLGHKPHRTVANRPDPRRYPLEPLARVAGIELGRMGGDQPGQRRGLLLLVELLGISREWGRHLNRFGLTETQADRYAVTLGHHPGSIWPEWWDAGGDIDDIDDQDGDLRDLAF